MAVVVETALAQKEPQFSQYMHHPLVYNPAFASWTEKHLTATLSSRVQWVGFDGRPETHVLTGSMPLAILAGNASAGVMYDVAGPEKRLQLMMGYAYKHILTVKKERMEVGGGVSLTFDRYWLDGDILRTPGGSYSEGIIDHRDPLLNTGTMKASPRPDASMGVFVRYRGGFAALSAVNLLGVPATFKGAAQTLKAKIRRHMFITGGYQVRLNPMWEALPTALIKTDFINVQIDMDILAQYAGKFAGGVGLRGLTRTTGDALVVHAGVKVLDNVWVTYSYDLTLSAIGNFSSGSHELTLHYLTSPVLRGRFKKIYYSPRFL